MCSPSDVLSLYPPWWFLFVPENSAPARPPLEDLGVPLDHVGNFLPQPLVFLLLIVSRSGFPPDLAWAWAHTSLLWAIISLTGI